MIAVGETLDYAAEVVVNFPTSSNPLVGLTGHVWHDSGDGITTDELQLLIPGGSWTNATILKIIEKGYGFYAIRLTAAQCVTAGTVYARSTSALTGVQPYFGSEIIGTTGGDIAVLGDGEIPFFLPNATDPIFGTPVTGHVFSAGEVLLCLPNGSFANANLSDIVEKGNGGYALKLTAAAGQTSLRGKAYLHVDIGAASQPVTTYVTILNISPAATTTSGTTTTTTPVTSPYTPSSPLYMDHVAAAVSRLCQYAKEAA